MIHLASGSLIFHLFWSLLLFQKMINVLYIRLYIGCIVFYNASPEPMH